ncbi:hypothetical protein COOONC_22183 [Cooperia oncophora]
MSFMSGGCFAHDVFFTPTSNRAEKNCYTFTDGNSLCAQKFTLPTDCLVFGNGSVVCVRPVERTEKRSSPRQESTNTTRSYRGKARIAFAIPALVALVVPKLAAILPGAAVAAGEGLAFGVGVGVGTKVAG